jgi:hypothetical protein
MPREFDPGYQRRPYRQLVADYPDETVYPADSFRVEWGPIFHRGRLDGTARLLVVGQDPAAHEAIARRILVGEAGQRIQGFLTKLGVNRSYVFINTFLYSVFGQGGGERHIDDEPIAQYRNRWLDAITRDQPIRRSLGHLTDSAVQMWRETPTGAKSTAVHVNVMHRRLDSAAAGRKIKAAAFATVPVERHAQQLHP